HESARDSRPHGRGHQGVSTRRAAKPTQRSHSGVDRKPLDVSVFPSLATGAERSGTGGSVPGALGWGGGSGTGATVSTGQWHLDSGWGVGASTFLRHRLFPSD